MHSVQAAPRQSYGKWLLRCGLRDALRAGSAEAKSPPTPPVPSSGKMHSVQAAPRQRPASFPSAVRMPRCTPCRQRRGKGVGGQLGDHIGLDALRAGSAEAKTESMVLEAEQAAMHSVQAAPRQRTRKREPNRLYQRCTPCRQRRGKAMRQCDPPAPAPRCTPCRQRRGKDSVETVAQPTVDDALRAGSAEAKAHQRKRDRRPMVISTTVRRFSYLPPPESPRLRPYPSSLCTIQSPSF